MCNVHSSDELSLHALAALIVQVLMLPVTVGLLVGVVKVVKYML